LALIRCAECGKEISDRAAACVYCGCPVKQQPLPALGSPGEKSPGAVRKAAAAVMAVLSVLSAFIYCESFISGRILSILMAAASVCLPLLVFFGGRFLHRRAVSILFLLLYAIATLAWAFAYNIDRLELDRGFFSYYDNTLGLFLGIFQIVSIISVLVLFFSAVLNVVKKKHAALAMCGTGLAGMIFYIYEISCLDVRWGIGLNFYYWAAAFTLLFFLACAVYMVSGDAFAPSRNPPASK